MIVAETFFSIEVADMPGVRVRDLSDTEGNTFTLTER